MNSPHKPSLAELDDETLPPWADQEWITGSQERRFDEFLNLPPEQRSVVARYVEERIAYLRKRAIKKDLWPRFEFTVGAIVANAIIAPAGKPQRCFYSRDQSLYQGATIYAPRLLRSKTLIKTVAAMERAKLLWGTVAPQGVRNPNRQRSTFRARPRLINDLVRLGISAVEVVRDDEAAPVILLRDAQKRNLNYNPTDVEAESAFLRAYNSFLAEQSLGLASGEAEHVDPSRRRLYRVYSHDLAHGGRFYGGFWQGLKKETRPHLLINGEATTELDYSAFLPRALHHEAGLECDFDPYDVPEIRAAFQSAGFIEDEARKAAKVIFFVMINAKQLKGIHISKGMRPLKGVMRPSKAIAAIMKRNEQIQDRFFTGYSLTIMKRDSDVCARVLEAGLQAGITVLPIHDSFLVQAEQKKWLRGEMIKAYEEEFGFSPTID